MTDDTKLKHLISAMLDDTLTEEQAKELDDILQNSPEAREIYRRMVDMHFTLNEISENKEVIDLYNSAKAKAPNGSDKIDAEIVDDMDDQLPEKVLSS